MHSIVNFLSQLTSYYTDMQTVYIVILSEQTCVRKERKNDSSCALEAFASPYSHHKLKTLNSKIQQNSSSNFVSLNPSPLIKRICYQKNQRTKESKHCDAEGSLCETVGCRLETERPRSCEG